MSKLARTVIGLVVAAFVLGGGPSSAATNYSWNVGGAGPFNWQDTANWLPTSGWPSAQDDGAKWLGYGGSPATIDLQGGTLTLGTFDMTPGNGGAFAVANGTLVFDVSSGNAILSQFNSMRTDDITADVTFSTNTIVSVLCPTYALFYHNVWGRALGLMGVVRSQFGLYKNGPGQLDLGSDNAITGTITVANGWVNPQIASWGTLGDAANPWVLGSHGARGGIGWFATLPTLTHAITLNGLGGMLHGYNNVTLDNAFSGSGELVVGAASWVYFDSTVDSTHSGGTRVVNYLTKVRTDANVFGSGDLRIEQYGAVELQNPTNNVSPGAKVLIGSTGRGMGENVIHGALLLANDSVPTIDPDSSGMIWLGNGLSSGPNINARFAAAAPQLGDGYMVYGSPNSQFYGFFTGTSLQPNLDGRYRFIPGGGVALDAPGTTGCLTGTNGVEIAVPGGMWGWGEVFSYDAQAFSGPVIIHHNARFRGYAFSTGNFLGAASGTVDLQSGLLSVVRGDGSSTPVQKGALTFQGSSYIAFDNQNDPAYTTRLDVATMVRSNRGILAVAAEDSSGVLGVSDQLTVASGAPAPVNGIVPPYFVDYNANAFLTYGGGGFAKAAFTDGTLTGAVATSIANVTNMETVPAGGIEVYALRAAHPILGNASGDKLKIGSGGLLLTAFASLTDGVFWVPDENHRAGRVAISAPIDFGNAEGVIYLGHPYYGDNSIPWDRTGVYHLTNRVYGTQGLTIGSHYTGNPGPRYLVLHADNSHSLTGTVTVNQGVLSIATSESLGPDSNLIVLNGGSGAGNANYAAIDANVNPSVTNRHPIWLGPEGGMLQSRLGQYYYFLTQAGKISGPGMLAMDGHSGGKVVILNDDNDYTGGTFIKGCAVWVGKTAEYVTTGTGKLGTGPVTIGGAHSQHASGSLYVYGTNAIDPSARVTIMRTFCHSSEKLVLGASSMRIGSLAGDGSLELAQGTDSTMYVGGNDESTEFSGFIYDYYWWNAGSLIKEGSGTFTLSGYNTYGGFPNFFVVGSTVVKGGTLLVNGTVQTPVSVTNGATLGGSGVINSNVVVTGATLAGGGGGGGGVLLVNGDVTLDAASAYQATLNGTTAAVDYGQLSATGTIALNDAALNVVLTYAAQVNDQFTIIDNPVGAVVSGQFACGGKFTTSYSGRAYSFAIDYAGGDGNDVVLNTIPQGTVILIR